MCSPDSMKAQKAEVNLPNYLDVHLSHDSGSAAHPENRAKETTNFIGAERQLHHVCRVEQEIMKFQKHRKPDCFPDLLQYERHPGHPLVLRTQSTPSRNTACGRNN